MQHANPFLQDFAIVLGVAAVTTVIFQKLRQPVVLGYILAGLIIGPHVAIPLVADQETVKTLSELGVILLMFSLGLEFSFSKLARVGTAASVTAVVQSSFMILLGFAVGRWMGWSVLESFFAGALIAISSTTIIAKAYDDLKVKGPLRELVVGVLVVEDLIAIVLMAALTALGTGKGLGANDLLGVLGSLGGFLFLLLIGGMLVIPRAMRAVGRFGSDETLLVSGVGICFFLAFLAEKAGYSVALGAFLAGTLIAESGQEERLEKLVGPVKDIFAAVFFVSVGMLLDPRKAAENFGAVLALTLAVVVGKVVFVFVGAFLTGRGVRTSAQAGLSLAQIGEFSFIIAALGVTLGAVGSQLYPVAVAVSAITTLLTPWMIRFSPVLAERFDEALPKRVQTFASLYGAWVERLGSTNSVPERRSRIRKLIAWVFLDTALLAGLIILTTVNVGRIAAWLETRIGLPTAFSSGAAIFLAVLLAIPLCFGIISLTQRLTLMLAEWSLPKPAEGELDSSAAPRRALSVALQTGFLLAVLAPILALTQPFLPGRVVAITVILVFSLAALLFWRSATDLQGHVRAGSEMLMELVASQGRGKSRSIKDMAILRQFLPGLGAPKVFHLTRVSPAVGKTLAELKIRGQTGATVLAVERQAKGIEVKGQLRLLAGDFVAVAGSSQALAGAEEMLMGAQTENRDEA